LFVGKKICLKNREKVEVATRPLGRSIVRRYWLLFCKMFFSHKGGLIMFLKEVFVILHGRPFLRDIRRKTGKLNRKLTGRA
jgi:hypothetical protein